MMTPLQNELLTLLSKFNRPMTPECLARASKITRHESRVNSALRELAEREGHVRWLLSGEWDRIAVPARDTKVKIADVANEVLDELIYIGKPVVLGKLLQQASLPYERHTVQIALKWLRDNGFVRHDSNNRYEALAS